MSIRVPAGVILLGIIILAACSETAAECMRYRPVRGDCGKPMNVKVTMVVILAKKEGKFIDKRLKHIASEIQKIHPELTSFEVKSMTDRSVPPGQKETFDLVDKKQAQVVIRHGADEMNKVGLVVSAPGLVGDIVYSTVCGKFLPIVTRYETAKGQWLILAIQVQPCKGG